MHRNIFGLRPTIDRTTYSVGSCEKNPTLPPSPLPPNRGGGGGRGPFLQDVKELVKQLSKKDQKELHSYLHLLEKSEQEEAASKDRFRSMLVDSLTLSLERKLKTRFYVTPSLNTELNQCSKVVESFILSTGWTFTSTGETKVILNFIADILVAHTHSLSEKLSRPLGLKFVLQQSIHLAGYFDKMFPGYLQAGMAPRVFEEKIKNSKAGISDK